MEFDNLSISNFFNYASIHNCEPKSEFFEIEAYCYLFIMCPLAIIGIVLNIICLLVFKNKCFTSVTFRYLRLIALSDFFICLVIIPYCITAYTQPFNKYDLYLRHFYLAYVFIPGANMAINLSTFLNLLVTIERLINVGWPTISHQLFKSSKFYLSCVLVIFIAVLMNISNFFLYKVELCKTQLIPRLFVMEKWWIAFGYIKEIITRILPITALTISNIVLVSIVRKSRKRMRKCTRFNIEYKKPDEKSRWERFINCFSDSKSIPSADTSNNVDSSLLTKNTNKRARQEHQLTWMTIYVAVLYVATTLPMVFAYPGILFSGEQTVMLTYKLYAAAVNILELFQCSFRFLIYFCFMTQFRQMVFQMFSIDRAQLDTQPLKTLRDI
jgi:hypothetical protein